MVRYGTRSPLCLQELCCRQIIDSVPSMDFPKFKLPADTYAYMERYVRHDKFWTLHYLYSRFYKHSGVQIFNLKRVDNYIFFKQLSLVTITRLNLRRCSSLLTENYIHILRQCKNIQFLNLSECYIDDKLNISKDDFPINDELLFEIASNCPELVELDITEAELSLDGVEKSLQLVVDGQKSFSQLKVLTYVHNYFDESVSKDEIEIFKIILKNCAKMEILNGLPMESLAQICSDRKKSGDDHTPLQLTSTNSSKSGACYMSFDGISFHDLWTLCPFITEMELDLGRLSSSPLRPGDIPFKLTSLILTAKCDSDSSAKTCGRLTLQILDLFGKHLEKLKLASVGYVKLVDIMQLCPQLQELYINVYKHYSKLCVGNVESSLVFNSLRKYCLGFDFGRTISPNMGDDEALMTITLFPNLAELSISNAQCFDTTMLLNMLMENKGMFLNLKDIRVYFSKVCPLFVLHLLTSIDRYPKLVRVHCDTKPGQEDKVKRINAYIRKHRLSKLVLVKFRNA